jgi:hypothetical protein
VREDFFSAYFNYVENTEPPHTYFRWTVISALGAILGRDYCFPHGHFTLYPNIYCMLIGDSGDRKSTAIKMMKSLIVSYGYNTIAADKTSKEKFLLDLAGEGLDDADKTLENSSTAVEDILDRNLWGDSQESIESKPPAEMYIMADEFNEFLGTGNIDFISMLGNLWDYSGVYKSRIKNGKSVSVPNPTISILGGNTPTNFSLAFPPEVLGQGFFSRLLLIYGEPSGRKITFPKKPSSEATEIMISLLKDIKSHVTGVATITPGAESLLDKSYRIHTGVDDARFDSYNNRRFTHLLKLCLVVSAARISTQITESDVVYANTILTNAENYMPKALGEFGKARHSDVAHKILGLLDRATKPVLFKEIWKEVHNDLEKMNDLQAILASLALAEKIQATNGGFLARKKMTEESNSDLLDYTLLTKEERSMSK